MTMYDVKYYARGIGEKAWRGLLWIGIIVSYVLAAIMAVVHCAIGVPYVAMRIIQCILGLFFGLCIIAFVVTFIIRVFF